MFLRVILWDCKGEQYFVHRDAFQIQVRFPQNGGAGGFVRCRWIV